VRHDSLTDFHPKDIYKKLPISFHSEDDIENDEGFGALECIFIFDPFTFIAAN